MKCPKCKKSFKHPARVVITNDKNEAIRFEKRCPWLGCRYYLVNDNQVSREGKND